MTVVEAARRLAMSHSTVSRHLEKSGVPRDDAGRFDFEAFTAWRAKSINPLKARNVDPDFALDRHDAAVPAAPSGEAKPLRQGSAPAGLGFGKAATAEKAVRAQLLKLQLDRETAKVASIEDLERAGETVGQLLQETLRRRNRDMAEELAAETDRHRVALLLAESDRQILAALAEEIVKAMQPFLPPPAPGQANGGQANGGMALAAE